MHALYLAASDMDRGDHHFVRIQFMHQQTDRRNIRDRVHGSDFMKVDLIDGFLMHVAFRFRDHSVYGKHVLGYFFWKRKVFSHQMFDLMQAAMFVMTVCMFMGVLMRMTMLVFMRMTVIVFVFMRVTVIVLMYVAAFTFLLAVHQNAHMRTADPALHSVLPHIFHARNSKPVQFCKEGFLIRQQL